MATLELQQARQLSAALTPLYTAPRTTDFYSRLAAAVNNLLGAELTCFDFFDQTGRLLNLGGNSPTLFTPVFLTQLATHIHEHPLFPGLFVERSPLPLKTTDFCSIRQHSKSFIYNEFYRTVGITHQLVVGFEVLGQGYTTCALSRARRDFTETERLLLAFVQPHLTALLRPARPVAPRLAALGLTSREADMLLQLAQGLPDKLIADRQRISPRTVQVHLRNLYAKLGVGNRTAAVVRYHAVLSG